MTETLDTDQAHLVLHVMKISDFCLTLYGQDEFLTFIQLDLGNMIHSVLPDGQKLGH